MKVFSVFAVRFLLVWGAVGLCWGCRSAPPLAGEKPPARQTSQIPVKFRTLTGENFRVGFAAPAEEQDAAAALRTLEAERADMARRLSAAGLDIAAVPRVEVVAYPTTGDFVAATGRPAWAGAVTANMLIQLQPLATLRQRRRLETTLRHEYTHAVIENMSRGRAPRWLHEGLALHVSGEGTLLPKDAAPLTVEQIEQGLSDIKSPARMQQLYAAAYREVAARILRDGEPALWQAVSKF